MHAAYNAAVIEYRQTHHIRSAAHPVPNLGVDGDAFEVPLWVWRKEDPVRRRLFVRQRTDGVTLLDRNGWSHDLPLIANGDNTVGIEELVGLGADGVRIRPRALTMTMFVRLVLAEPAEATAAG